MGESCRDGRGTPKKGRYFMMLLLLLLAAGIVYAVIRFYPVWRSAEVMHREAGFSGFSYEVEVELYKEKLPEEQQKLLDVVERLTGCEPDAMYQLRVRGSVWEDKIHVFFYPKGMQEPLIEMYLSSDEDMLNETALYNVIRENLVGQYGMLGLLMPEQTEDRYITLEQVEQMFGVDLTGIRSFALSETEQLSAWQYFALLIFLQEEKLENGRIFTMAEEEVQLQLAVMEEEAQFPVKLALSVKDTEMLAGKLDLTRFSGLLPGIEIQAPSERPAMLKAFKVVLTWGENREIRMPEELVSQETVDMISNIRQLVQKLTGKQNEDSGQ